MDDWGTTLFRNEVYAARRDQWLGAVAQAAPIPHGLRAVLWLIVILAVFLACLEYSRHAHVIGVVAPRTSIESQRRIAIGFEESASAVHRSYH